jgi:glycosyltransferase involved in cell wall biosynthesis
MSPITIDLTEFLGNPIQTGIQRVVRQLLRNWPNSSSVRFARYDREKEELVSVSDRSVNFAVSNVAELDIPLDRMRQTMSLLQNISRNSVIEIGAKDRILVPELFYDHDRVAFYCKLHEQDRGRRYFIVYDFVPWLNPSVYRIGHLGAAGITPYLHMIMRERNLAFISASVREEFQNRILRSNERSGGYVVVPLGADGLSLEKQTFDASRTDLICVGSLEGKKHQEIVFHAFRSLPAGGDKLRFLGRVPSNLAPWLQVIKDYSGHDLELVENPSDELMRSYFRTARASIFISTNEGFGLPAIESLYCGVPIVVYSSLPALAGVPGDGQVRLTEVNGRSVAEAIQLIRDDHNAERLWREAATLNLPTWKHFGRSVCEWVSG